MEEEPGKEISVRWAEPREKESHLCPDCSGRPHNVSSEDWEPVWLEPISRSVPCHPSVSSFIFHTYQFPSSSQCWAPVSIVGGPWLPSRFSHVPLPAFSTPFLASSDPSPQQAAGPSQRQPQTPAPFTSQPRQSASPLTPPTLPPLHLS